MPPRRAGITVSCTVQDDVLDIACGEGYQTIKWLGLTDFKAKIQRGARAKQIKKALDEGSPRFAEFQLNHNLLV